MAFQRVACGGYFHSQNRPMPLIGGMRRCSTALLSIDFVGRRHSATRCPTFGTKSRALIAASAWAAVVMRMDIRGCSSCCSRRTSLSDHAASLKLNRLVSRCLFDVCSVALRLRCVDRASLFSRFDDPHPQKSLGFDSAMVPRKFCGKFLESFAGPSSRPLRSLFVIANGQRVWPTGIL